MIRLATMTCFFDRVNDEDILLLGDYYLETTGND